MHTENRFKRVYHHLFVSKKTLRQNFPMPVLKRLEAMIAASEAQHVGQVRLVIENSLPLGDVWRGVSPRERAWQHFSQLGVWDTEYNTGVLLYVGLVDHALEIVADRGIARSVDETVWQHICQQLSQAFVAQQFETGLQVALEQMTAVLLEHAPRQASHVSTNELSDEVVVR